jgi:hypothetical protein
MRTLVRAGAVVLWACLVGTAAGTYGIAEAAGSAPPRAQSGCIEINGALHTKSGQRTSAGAARRSGTGRPRRSSVTVVPE